jgi:hypothetical protein
MTKEIDYVELLKLAHEKLGSQSDMIAELEKELKKYKCLEGDLIYIDKKELLQRDLEQRANGIMDVRKANVRKKRTLGSMWDGGHIIHNMQLAEEELRNQAKALKEQE